MLTRVLVYMKDLAQMVYVHNLEVCSVRFQSKQKLNLILVQVSIQEYYYTYTQYG